MAGQEMDFNALRERGLSAMAPLVDASKEVGQNLASARQEANQLGQELGQAKVPSVLGQPGSVQTSDILADSIRRQLARSGFEEQSFDQLDAARHLHSEAPGAGRYGSQGFAGPDDLANPDMAGAAASKLWRQMQEGGAYHLLQSSGKFGMSWGGALQGEDADSQRGWANAAASPDGRAYMGAREELDGIAKSIHEFLETIAKGGPEAVKAAEGLKKAEAALKDVATAGRKAADGIGGEMGSKLSDEMRQAEESAASGAGPSLPAAGDSLSRSPLSGRQMLGMLQDPASAGASLLQMGASALLQKGLLNGIFGGANWGTAGVAAGGAVATGAALYGGYKFADWRMDKAQQDADEHLRDLQLGNSLGMDWRGTFYSDLNSSSGVKKGYSWKNGSFNVAALREVAPALGYGMGEKAWKGGTLDGAATADHLWNVHESLGVDVGSLSSFVGQSLVSGGTGATFNEVNRYLGEIATYTQRAADQGVTTNVALSSIAQLNQRQVEALGKLAPESQRFNMAMLDALNATGDPSMRGAQGAKVVGNLMGPVQAENHLAMLFGSMSSKDRAELIRTFGGDDADAISHKTLAEQAEIMGENPAAAAAMRTNLFQSGKVRGVPDFMARRLVGLDGMGWSQFHRFRSEAESGHLDWHHLSAGVGASDLNFRSEGRDSVEAIKLSQRAVGAEKDRDRSGFGPEDLKAWREAASSIKGAADKLATVAGMEVWHYMTSQPPGLGTGFGPVIPIQNTGPARK